MKRLLLIVALSFALVPRFSWALRPGGNVALTGDFGMGGETTIETKVGDQTTKGEEDFKTTLGVGAWADYALSGVAALGGELRALWWNGEVMDDQNIDRSLYVDIGPSLRLGFEPVPMLTLYLRFAPGLSILFLADDMEAFVSAGAQGLSADISTGFGFNIASFGGAQIHLADTLGLIIELGYIYHMTFGEISVGTASVDYTVDGGQFHINAGLAF